MEIREKLCETSALIHENLREIFYLFPHQEELFDAMRYSVLAESSHIRGFLLLELGKLFDLPHLDTLEVASAIEMIHSFSLIHDDLPALDNSDERRNQPACHITFSESTAILAGDALLALSYQLLSRYGTPIVQEASKYILEMILGQTHDLKCGTNITPYEVNRMKTGALFALSSSSAGLLANIGEKELTILKTFGYEIGLIFQATDDIQDGDGKDNSHSTIRASLDKSREMIRSTFLNKKRHFLEEFLDFLCNRVL